MRKVFAFSVTALCLALASEAAAQTCAGGPELFLKSFNGDIVLRQE